MRIFRELVNNLPRITAIAIAMLFAQGYLNLTTGAAAPLVFKHSPALAAVFDEEAGAVHQPLATLGVTRGQTVRINVVNSPNPKSSILPGPCTVEMCFHDVTGNLILDRFGQAVRKTVTIDPHHGDSLDLIGDLVAGPGGRVVILPCVRILSLNEGTLAVPTVELYNDATKTTSVLSPGVARGFDPQPDPPALPEVAFGLVGITQGVTARLYVLNAKNPTVGDPHEPITVEMTFHDANDRIFVDRAGHPSRKIVTIDPNHADFLELNGNEIAALGAQVGVVPCVKVLTGSSSSFVVPTFEMYINLTQQTQLLSNFSDGLTATVQDELIANGGFEDSAAWVCSGTGAFRASTNNGTGDFPHSGSGYLVLANADSVSGQAYQQINIPSDATSADLTFWLNVTSAETTTTEALDRLFVEVRNTAGTLLSTVATFSNLSKTTVAGDYSKKGIFCLLGFRGQTVRIQFRATTNESLSTTFRIDDVSVR